MTGKDIVLVEQRGKVRVLTLNRPERLNALNIPLLAALKQALLAANTAPETQVIVLRGAGRAFCAGKDLKDHVQTGNDADALRSEISLLHDVSREILFGEKPVIAGVHGWAVGGGLEIMINCDLVILEDGATMYFPEMSLGLFVTCGVTALLPRMIGLSQSKVLMMGGEKFDAARAKDLGLAWQVYSADDFEHKLIEHASTIANMPQASLRQLKKTLAKSLRREIEAALDVEAELAERAALDQESQQLIKTRFPEE